MYYSNSEAKTQLENWYSTNIKNNTNYSKYIATGNYYCEEAKTKRDSSYTSGNATMTTYEKYVPDFKCTTDVNGKGVVNASVGLITYDEVVYAGGYPLESNTTYYLNNNKNFWTMGPAGFDSTYARVWRVYNTGAINTHNVNGTDTINPVINLKADTQISSGTGISSDPYVVAN